MIGLLIKSTILWDLFSLFPAYAGVIPVSHNENIILHPFPRIRGGDPKHYYKYNYTPELFPAYAGVILFYLHICHIAEPFPRIRGGDPGLIQAGIYQSIFSPHTRG